MSRGKNNIENLKTRDLPIHPAWVALIKHCQEIGYGEIERIKIQSGLPVLVEKTTQRIKLT